MTSSSQCWVPPPPHSVTQHLELDITRQIRWCNLIPQCCMQSAFWLYKAVTSGGVGLHCTLGGNSTKEISNVRQLLQTLHLFYPRIGKFTETRAGLRALLKVSFLDAILVTQVDLSLAFLIKAVERLELCLLHARSKLPCTSVNGHFSGPHWHNTTPSLGGQQELKRNTHRHNERDNLAFFFSSKWNNLFSRLQTQLIS